MIFGGDMALSDMTLGGEMTYDTKMAHRGEMALSEMTYGSEMTHGGRMTLK
jgi:hypothetical protein